MLDSINPVSACLELSVKGFLPLSQFLSYLQLGHSRDPLT